MNGVRQVFKIKKKLLTRKNTFKQSYYINTIPDGFVRNKKNN